MQTPPKTDDETLKTSNTEVLKYGETSEEEDEALKRNIEGKTKNQLNYSDSKSSEPQREVVAF